MKKLLLLLLAAGCCFTALQAQVAPARNESTAKDVVSRLQSRIVDKFIEKAYLQFDRPYYNAGDTIYFKAYVTAGERHELSKISGVLHVDLISANDSIMQSVILQLKNGLAWGDFALLNNLAKGNYRIRVYTRWMQNAKNAYLFNKIIPINGRTVSQKLVESKTNDKPDVQFFAEGGTFVTDIPTRIAFKAVSTTGAGVFVKGTVVDNNNVPVAKFTTAHLGMGQLFITPEKGKTYTANITYPDGSTGTIALPKAEDKGIRLIVDNNDPDKLTVDINANKAYFLENRDKDITVVIYSSGVVKTVKAPLDNEVVGFDVLKKDLAPGIAQITLFSSSGVPVSERLVFIQNRSDVNLTLNSDKATYTRFDKAQLTLNAKSTTDKASTANYSVAVVNESKVKINEDDETSILSDMLLTSDLRGYVEQPGYYFNNATADTRNNLDILMLTQGYRRFEWKDLLHSTGGGDSLTVQSEVGMSIKGTLVSKAGKPVANEKITLMLAATGQSKATVTDGAGKFAFPDLAYADKTQFLLTIANKALYGKAKIVLDKIYQPLPVTAGGFSSNNAEVKLPEYAGAIMEQTTTSKQLKPVYVKEKLNYKTSSLAGAGNADQVIFSKDLKGFSTLSQGLNGIARNIDFNNGHAYIKNGSVMANGDNVREPMMMVIDGAIMSGDAMSSGIDVVNPGDVESIEILKGANAFVYGMGSGAGVIVINTKQGGNTDVISREMSPGILSVSPQGFYSAREFYSPVYDIYRKPVADDRTTIFWKPDLITDDAGNAAFSYFNSSPGMYRIVVEGIDNTGNVGRAVYKYTVK
jgi:TonB-dependent SusC/RagA subfamily outer membrane receptor